MVKGKQKGTKLSHCLAKDGDTKDDTVSENKSALEIKGHYFGTFQ